MTNKEYAASLLIEAADLLAESDLLEEGAQADAYKAKKREERLSKYDDDKQRRMNVEYSKDGRSKVYHAQTGSIMDYDSKEGRIITKAEKNGLSKNDALKHDQKMRDIAHKASEITRKEANRRDQLAKASGKVYDKDFDSDYQSVMDATNRHIRRHDRLKAQNESVDELLNECYDLLEEGARRPGRQMIKQIDKADAKLSNFFMGLLDKAEAKAIYDKNIAECDRLKSQIVNLPNDTWMDKILNKSDVRRMLGTSSLSTSENIGIGTNGNNSGTTVAETKSYTANERNAIKAARKNSSFTREKVFKAIETFRAKIENAWNKYYADKVQNESVCNIDIDDLELD